MFWDLRIYAENDNIEIKSNECSARILKHTHTHTWPLQSGTLNDKTEDRINIYSWTRYIHYRYAIYDFEETLNFRYCDPLGLLLATVLLIDYYMCNLLNAESPRVSVRVVAYLLISSLWLKKKIVFQAWHFMFYVYVVIPISDYFKTHDCTFLYAPITTHCHKINIINIFEFVIISIVTLIH